MWTYILNKDVSKFLKLYPNLEEDWKQFSLLEIENATFVPRHFIKNFPSELLKVYEKQALNQSLIRHNFNFNWKFRDEQQEAVDAILKLYNTNNYFNGIVKMYPGAGKTVLTIGLAALLKMKTLIIVDNTDLLKQWITEIIDCTDLKIDDIGLIKENHFVTDKPIVMATAQTLLSKIKRNFKKIFDAIDNSQFQLIVFDEVHKTSCSEKFAKVSMLFRTMNILGLSATPYQNGTAEILMNNTIGDIIYSADNYKIQPNYWFYYYKSGLSETRSINKDGSESKLTYLNKLNRLPDLIKKKSFYNSIIYLSDNYLNNITQCVNNLRQKDYNVIIVCSTHNQVKAVSQRLDDNKIKNRRFYGKENEIDKDEDNVIVATYSYAGTGFNMKRLDAMIIATPISGKKSLIQVVGRILRAHTGKIPIVVHLIDLDFGLFFTQEAKRSAGIIKNEFRTCKILEHRCFENVNQE